MAQPRKQVLSAHRGLHVMRYACRMVHAADWQHCWQPAPTHTCEHHLAGHEDEQHDLGLLHAVDQAGEQLWLVLHGGKCRDTSKGTQTGRAGHSALTSCQAAEQAYSTVSYSLRLCQYALPVAAQGLPGFPQAEKKSPSMTGSCSRHC